MKPDFFPGGGKAEIPTVKVPNSSPPAGTGRGWGGGEAFGSVLSSPPCCVSVEAEDGAALKFHENS